MTSGNSAPRPVLVGVDGSASATEAVRWAAAEARRRATGLRLVEAFGWMPAEGDPVAPSYRHMLLEDARARLTAAADAAGRVAPDVRVVIDVITGFPLAQLVAESRTAQLVVIGDRGLGTFRGALLGSVADGLAAHAACPTVVVRGGGPDGAVPVDGPVVVGVDGSPTGEAATAFAFEAAAARGVPLVAVHAWQDAMVGTSVELLIDWKAEAAAQRRVLAERLAAWGAKYPDVPVGQVVVLDQPAHLLRARSAGAQLLVVGSRGRGGLAGMLLGSVSRSVLHHAACPVAIVRPETGGPR